MLLRGLTMTDNTEALPRDFNELVSWATWQAIEGITKGEPLRNVMHGILMGAVQIMQEWKKQ